MVYNVVSVWLCETDRSLMTWIPIILFTMSTGEYRFQAKSNVLWYVLICEVVCCSEYYFSCAVANESSPEWDWVNGERLHWSPFSFWKEGNTPFPPAFCLLLLCFPPTRPIPYQKTLVSSPDPTLLQSGNNWDFLGCAESVVMFSCKPIRLYVFVLVS